MTDQSNHIYEIAEDHGKRAALRLHMRVERSASDKQGILANAKAVLESELEAEGVDCNKITLALNVMIAAYANRLNDLYQTGTPGGTDGPASVI